MATLQAKSQPKHYIKMSVKSFSKNIKTLSVSPENVVELGSAEGKSVNASINVITAITGDSDWQFVQSNDKTNWSLITGGDFVAAAGHQEIEFSNTGLYLGLKYVAANTEGAFLNFNIDVCIKE